MSVYDDVRDALFADAALAALVEGRIYQLQRPQAAQLPFLVYQRISSVPELVQQGMSGLAASRVQFAAWAKTPAEAARVAAAARWAAMQASRCSLPVGAFESVDADSGYCVAYVDMTIVHEED